MAYWTRRRDGAVKAFEWKNGKQVSIARARLRHLDAQPGEVVDRFIASLNPIKPTITLTDDKLTSRVEEFEKYEAAPERGLDPYTISTRKACLLQHVVPYFLERGLPDPRDWSAQTAGLLPYFRSKNLTDEVVKRSNTALLRFWKWMREEGYVDTAMLLALRNPRKRSQPTPLQFTVTPEQVLAHQGFGEIEFMALCGFFFSLRPQETLALTKRDFLAGTAATQLECCKVMARNELYGRLAVNVNKQHSKSKNQVDAEPKGGSKGWVSCFNVSAATRIVALIKELAPDRTDTEPIVRFSVDYNTHRWSQHGIPGIKLKDLRRASIYWLGHYTDLGLIPLRNHARHKDIETTALYLRRPEDKVVSTDELDLDA